MSVADVCELGAFLKRDADETLALETKKKELDSTAKTVERKFDFESEEGVKCDRAQQKLLELAQNEGSRFEVLSLNLSQIKKECAVAEELKDFFARVDRYLLAKKEMEANIINIKNELVGMEEKIRVQDTSGVRDETIRSLQKIVLVVADKNNSLHGLQQFDVAALEEQASAEQAKLDGFLQDTAAMVESDCEQKRTEIEAKTEQYETPAAAERKEREDAWSAQKNLSANSSVKIASLQAKSAEIKAKVIAAKADGDSSESALEGARQRQSELREKAIQLEETESRVQGVLAVANGKLNDAKETVKTCRKDEESFIKERNGLDSAEERDQGSSSTSLMDTTALTKARDTLRETLDAIDREAATLSPLVAGESDSDITDSRLDEVIKSKTNLGDRHDKALAATTEQTSEKSELEVENDAKTALLNTALKEKEELEATSAQVSSEVEALQAKVQEIVAQIASTTSMSRSASSSSIVTSESSVLDEQVQDLERQKEQVKASLTKAEEHRAVIDNAAPAAQQELDVLRAHRAYTDMFALRQKELATMEGNVKTADKAFQAKVKTAENELKGLQVGLTDAAKEIEQQKLALKGTLDVIASDIRGLGGEEELMAFEKNGASEQQRGYEEEKQSMSQSSVVSAAMVTVHRSRSGGGAVRGTPPEDSWATSAGATLDATFASGLDDDEPLNVKDYLPNESRQLLEAQELHSAAIAPKPNSGGARGREMRSRNTQSAHSQHNDGQPDEIMDDGAVADGGGVGKQSQQKQGTVRRRHRQT